MNLELIQGIIPHSLIGLIPRGPRWESGEFWVNNYAPGGKYCPQQEQTNDRWSQSSFDHLSRRNPHDAGHNRIGRSRHGQ